MVEVEDARLVQQNGGFIFIENSAIMPRLKKCQVRQIARIEALDDVVVETSQKREGKQWGHFALSAIIEKMVDFSVTS